MKPGRLLGYLIAAGLIPVAASGAQAPRFLVVPTDTTQPLIVVDTTRLPSLRQRVALSVDGAPVADALRSLMRASRLDFVFETQLVANARPAALGRDSMTVATALIRLLDGAGVDVLMQSPTTMVLVRTVAGVSNPLSDGPVIRRDRISGRVTDSISGRPLDSTTVIATMAPSREVFRTTADSTGRYVIDVEKGTGDYLVYIAAVGHRAFRKRVTRVGAESIFTVNAALAREVSQLATVNVRGVRAIPGRVAEQPRGFGGDQLIDGLSGMTEPALAGDLSAIASTVPAFALGGSAAQNSFSFGGMMLPGAEIPRDLPVHIRVATSPFNATQGWFNGGAVSIAPIRNGTYYTTNARLTTHAAPSAASRGPTRGFNAGVGTDGPLDFERRWRYTAAAQGGRTFSAATTMFDADAAVLGDAGFSPDSIAALQAVMIAKGLPFAGPTSQFTDEGRFFLDVSRNIQGDTGTVFGLTASGGGSRTHGTGLSPRGTPSTAGQLSSGSALLMGSVSKFMGRYHLIDVRSGLTASRAKSSPELRLPAARVLIESQFADGSADAADAFIGGSGIDDRTTDRVGWQNAADLSFSLNRDPRHMLKFRGDFVVEKTRRSVEDFGSFRYSSLDALRLDAPDSYTRMIQQRPSDAGVWNGALAMRDAFAVSRTFTVTYGGRVDFAGFFTAPPADVTVDQRFGVRTGWIPGTVHFSPRIGFAKRFTTPPLAVRTNDRGAFWSLTSFLRGGIGEFRGITTSQTLLEAAAAADGAVTLSCIGAATPVPDWSGFASSTASIPSDCASGAPATYIDNAPTVHVFARSYSPPRTWKANLNYRWLTSHFVAAVDANYALNLNEAGTLDRNLATVPAFLSAGDGRWVYAPPTSIVTSSGAVSRSAARIDPAFGSVLEHRSDLRSALRAISFELMPNRGGFAGPLRLTYTMSELRGDVRGRNGTAFGAVDVTERARASGDVRHSFQVMFGIPAPAGFSINGIARVRSGRPYTPVVAADVNGDGLANDRAFIDPATAAYSNLIASAPSHARQCLIAQQSNAAAHNSCTGPWAATLDGRVRVNRPELARRRITAIDLSLNNVLSGLDGLINGDDRRGWGEAGIVDPVLYQVRGFDPAANRFIYETNPAFGRTRSLSRVTNPFRLTLEVQMRLSPPTRIQQFRFEMLRGRNGNPGVAMNRERLRTRFGQRVLNPYTTILQLSDSLLLSRTQIDSMRLLQASIQARLAPLWEEASAYVAALPEPFDENALFEYQRAAVIRGWEMTWRSIREELAPLLTPLQLSLVTGWLKTLYLMPEFDPAWSFIS